MDDTHHMLIMLLFILHDWVLLLLLMMQEFFMVVNSVLVTLTVNDADNVTHKDSAVLTHSDPELLCSCMKSPPESDSLRYTHCLYYIKI